MNLLEHYIRKIIDITDVSDEYIKRIGKDSQEFKLEEPIYRVELECECYGHIETRTEMWYRSHFEEILRRGYFLS